MATLIDILAAGVVDSSGEALSNGVVYFYQAGTTTPVTVYQDADEEMTHSNPATLDAAGKLTAYANENIKLVIETSAGASVDTIDDVPTGVSTSDISLTDGVDAENFSGSTLSSVLSTAATSLGADFNYKYKSVGNTRTYLSRGADRVSVMDFGATGDGVTDDTAAIQAGLDALTSGATLYFPAGTYNCSSALAVNNSNITLLGEGSASKITGGSDYRYIDIDADADYVTIDSLWIAGTGGSSFTNPSYGIFAEATAAARNFGLTIKNCRVTGFGNVGIEPRHCENVQILNCIINDINFAGILTRSCYDILVQGCHVSDIQNSGTCYGITFTRTDTVDTSVNPLPTNNRAIGNFIEDVSNWAGLDTHAGINTSFVGNIVKDCHFGILCGPETSTDFAPKYCNITGNVVIGSGSGTNSYGITCLGKASGVNSVQDYAEGCVVSNNVIYGHGNEDTNEGAALYTYATRGVSITGNTLELCGANGIDIPWNAEGMNITGNTIRDVYSSTNANCAGIRMNNGFNSGIIGNNVFQAISTAHTYDNVNCIYIDSGGTGTNPDLILTENSNDGFTNYRDGADNLDRSLTTGNYRKPHRWEASAAPGSGAYVKGDFIYNNSPDYGEAGKFVNISSGSPGTWVQPYIVRNVTSSATNPSTAGTTGTDGDIQWRGLYNPNFPIAWLHDGTNRWFEAAQWFTNRLFNADGVSAQSIDLCTVDLDGGNNNDSVLIQADVLYAVAGTGAETLRIVWHAFRSGGSATFTTPVVNVLDDNLSNTVTALTASWNNVGTDSNNARITQGTNEQAIMEVRFRYVSYDTTKVTAFWPS